MKHSNIAFFIPHSGCRHTCSFCDQRAISGEQKPVASSYVAQVCEKAAKEIKEPKNTEIAFFGGSFTAIDRDYMLELLKAAYPYTKIFAGIRVSTRPDAIDVEILNILKKFGVTSIELGAQSMDDNVLNANGRGHTAQDVSSASNMIKEWGFSLGLQMMTGLYKSTDEIDRFTAEEFIKLKPDTVRIYPTVVLEGTRLARLYENGIYNPPSLEQTVNLCAGLLYQFYKQGIPVIKLGLHASEDVRHNFKAGAYHPALRELCEAEIFKRLIEKEITKSPTGEKIVQIPKGCLSKAIGQKKSNIYYFREMGYNVTLKETRDFAGYQVRIKK